LKNENIMIKAKSCENIDQPIFLERRGEEGFTWVPGTYSQHA